jgi:glycerol-3-phosphate acyltransferase PlsY
MDPFLALTAALTGYLLGSISFARIVTRLAAPEQDISNIKITLPDSDAGLESDAVSATTVRLHVGPRYGCLTSVLDMAKAGAPALAFRIFYPEAPYYLIVAGMATVGHNWPVYHRFKGGRGLSPILGGMLVIDWVGVLVTNLIGFLLGLPSRNLLIVTGGGIVFMIPWIWFRTGDLAQLTYAFAMNVIYWASMIPEIQEYQRLRQEGHLKDFQEADQLRVVGRRAGEVVDELSLSKIVRLITGRKGSKEPGTPDS